MRAAMTVWKLIQWWKMTVAAQFRRPIPEELSPTVSA
jgi:hypothetical protein